MKAPDTKDTRPATDRVREALFSSLGAVVDGARVVDLYAGSGSLGLEALSRGAASAVFVESGRKAVHALRHNLSAVGLGGELVEGPVRTYLQRSAARFDLVFMDPPWDQPAETMSDEMLLLDRLLDPGAVVVVSRRSGDPAPRAPETWRVAAEKRYGDTKLLRYEKLEADHDDGPVPG